METIVDRLIRYKSYTIQRLNEAKEKIVAQIGEEEHFDDLYDRRRYHFKQQLVPQTLIESVKEFMNEGIEAMKMMVKI
jgi:hypothetical protein